MWPTSRPWTGSPPEAAGNRGWATVADIVALRRAVAVAPTKADLVELIRSTGLTGLVRQASEYAPAADPPGRTVADRVLPVLPALRPLLSAGGLRRGTIVAVSADPGPAPTAPGLMASGLRSAGSGAARKDAIRRALGPTPAEAGASSAGGMSLLLALLAGASGAGSWCAVVGLPTLGAVAAAELGVELSRLALVPSPGPEWTGVVASLLDGFDVVVAAPPGPVAAAVAARLAARARQRGSVLVMVESGPPVARCPGVEVTLEAVDNAWEGLGQGHGRLARRWLTVQARGRGAAARRRQVRLWLPTFTGGLADDTPSGWVTGFGGLAPQGPRRQIVQAPAASTAPPSTAPVAEAV